MNVRARIMNTDRVNQDGTKRQDILARLQPGDRLYLEDYSSEQFPYAIGVETRDYELCGFLSERAAQEFLERREPLNTYNVYVESITDDSGQLNCSVSVSLPTGQPQPAAEDTKKQPTGRKKTKRNKNQKKKRKTGVIVLSVLFAFFALVAVLASQYGDSTPKDKDVPVFDAMKFWESDGLPIRETALIEMMGPPDSVEEWNDEREDAVYRIKDLYYGNDTYSFYEGRLRSLQLIDAKIPYSSRSAILGMFNLRQTSKSETNYTGVAYRVSNCGVPSFWVQSMDDKHLDIIRIIYNDPADTLSSQRT